MGCSACGNKSRVPRQSPSGKPVNQTTQPARSSGMSTTEKMKDRMSKMRWNNK